MEGTRSALIVASDEYTDPGLRLLRAPARDAEALAEVLRDSRIGDFEVRTLLNQPAHEVNLAVEEFFADRRPDDLLLVHFSCHGVKDEDGELYFATANTQLRRLGATAVAADFVNRRMNRSRSRRVVLLLDCCYAGAFEHGMTARADSAMGIKEQFGGRGRAVITASSAMEYAFEGDELTETGSLAPSVFTRALVEGLRTGEADRDQDGMVALDELYDYVYDTVRATTPNQTPGKWTFGVQGELYIARRASPVAVPSPLPPELEAATRSAFVGVRAGAVPELARLLQGPHAGLALAARLTLEQLTDDDSRMVSSAASAVLAAQEEPAPPEPALPEPAPAPEAAPPEPAPATTAPTAAGPPVTVAPSDDQVGPPRRDRFPRRRVPWLVGAAVVVVTVAVGVQRLGGGPPASSTTSSAASTTTAPKVAGLLGWKRVTAAGLGGPGDQAMSSVAATSKPDARYLAGGFTTSGDGRDGAIWTSPDGRGWRPVADQDLGGPGDQAVTTVTDYRGTLLAVGYDRRGGDSDVAAWQSPDGRTWDRVGERDLDEPGSQQVNRVWNSGQGMLAAGYETLQDGDVDGVIWRYHRDLAHWDRVSDRSFAGPGRQVVWRAIQADLGYGTRYIAVGGSSQGYGDEDGAVWTSSDLRSWEPVKDRSLGGTGDQEVTDLAQFGSGLVAAGFERRDGDTRGVVWRSDDGRSWSRVADPDMAGLGADGMLTRVVAPGDAAPGMPRLIAAGFSGKDGAYDAAVWNSQTGTTWSREAVFSGPGDQEIRSLLPTRSGVLAVGDTTSGQGTDAAVWVGTPRQ